MKLPILGLLASLTLMVSVPVATSEIPTLSGTETASITPPLLPQAHTGSYQQEILP